MGISTIEHSVVGVGKSGTGMLIAAIGDSENRPVPVETTMSTPSLPPEILDLIVGHLCDKTALKTCCIVSKSWVPRNRAYLFALDEGISRPFQLPRSPHAQSPDWCSLHCHLHKCGCARHVDSLLLPRCKIDGVHHRRCHS